MNNFKLDETTNQVVSQARTMKTTNSYGMDFENWPLDLLVDYVVKFHHRNIRLQAPEIQALLDNICSVHGKTHPSLYEVRDLFAISCENLDNHLAKEENVLFPYLYELTDAAVYHQATPPFHCGSVAHPIAVMMNEHELTV